MTRRLERQGNMVGYYEVRTCWGIGSDRVMEVGDEQTRTIGWDEAPHIDLGSNPAGRSEARERARELGTTLRHPERMALRRVAVDEQGNACEGRPGWDYDIGDAPRPIDEVHPDELKYG